MGSVDYRSQRVSKSTRQIQDEIQILDEERRLSEARIHVRYQKRAKDTTYLPESGELCCGNVSRRATTV
ncbi:hypothetical protein Tco_0549273 [Tanacetum coccineum]